ncbi:MAG: transcription termination/antitermination protein NusG [Mycoplasmataceae bacterium]|nr:transcription termination/antitermination protein NusG [Mycoplasmataceae bacterium]
MKNNKKWYIVQVVTGYEQKVKEDLENRDFDKADIEEILLARKLHTTKTGNIKSKPMFPGYLYVKVEMTDESWFIIRNTNYVTGIVGSSGQRTKPTPVREEEIMKIKDKALEEELRIKNIEEKNDKKSIITDVSFKINDVVKIIEGEFSNQEGKVTSISIETQKVSVEIEFFGRLIQVEMDLSLVKKI